MLSTILTKSFSKDTALLILRVITGTVLIHHGYEKLANIENFADAFVRPLHLPFPIFLSWVTAIGLFISLSEATIKIKLEKRNNYRKRLELINNLYPKKLA